MAKSEKNWGKRSGKNSRKPSAKLSAKTPGKSMGERVRRLRLEKGWSQSELATRLPEVKQQSIDQLEQGKVRRPRYLPELAKALGSSAQWLLTGVGDRLALALDAALLGDILVTMEQVLPQNSSGIGTESLAVKAIPAKEGLAKDGLANGVPANGVFTKGASPKGGIRSVAKKKARFATALYQEFVQRNSYTPAQLKKYAQHLVRHEKGLL